MIVLPVMSSYNVFQRYMGECILFQTSDCPIRSLQQLPGNEMKAIHELELVFGQSFLHCVLTVALTKACKLGILWLAVLQILGSSSCQCR